ncbi:MAG: M14 family zinc carboxypeptidase [Kiritimatiellae bacterium]|nr:M14 family zinc carboxypeptidase [Kiritimatiellia bacterium]
MRPTLPQSRARCRGGETWILTGWFLAVTVVGATERLTVTDSFPGGSAEVRSLDARTRTIELSPRCHPGRGWPCWWYARVDGTAPGETVTVRVVASQTPYRGTSVLSGRWALPNRAVISADNVHWSPTPRGRTGTREVVYTLVSPGERFWIAWGPPFLPAHAEALLMKVSGCVTGSERFVLARTREGRDVPAIRLGQRSGPAVWVQARQHAWEVGSSWVGAGLLEWAASDEPAAVGLREQAELWFVPIMDVDNVWRGAGGKEAEPRDHNRDWDDSPHYPEVAAAQRHLGELGRTGRLRLFVDLHQPGWENQPSFLYGPFNYTNLPTARRAAYDRFLQLLSAAATGPLTVSPQYQVASHVGTEEERARMSRSWVQRHGGPDVVAVTLETRWNLPESTSENYRQLGAALGRAIARFLERAPASTGEAGNVPAALHPPEPSHPR